MINVEVKTYGLDRTRVIRFSETLHKNLKLRVQCNVDGYNGWTWIQWVKL